MLLQVKYGLWKKMVILIALTVIIIGGLGLYYSIRANLYEKDVSKLTMSMQTVNNDINSLKSKPLYHKYILAEYIAGNENSTNYMALYKYLNRLKNDLEKQFKNLSVSRFKLSVKEGEINIETATNSYNSIYSQNGILSTLTKKDFVSKLNINSYRNVNSLIYFNIDLKTK